MDNVKNATKILFLISLLNTFKIRNHLKFLQLNDNNYQINKFTYLK